MQALAGGDGPVFVIRYPGPLSFDTRLVLLSHSQLKCFLLTLPVPSSKTGDNSLEANVYTKITYFELNLLFAFLLTDLVAVTGVANVAGRFRSAGSVAGCLAAPLW